MQATDFVVARNDLQQCKVIDTRCLTRPRCLMKRCW